MERGSFAFCWWAERRVCRSILRALGWVAHHLQFWWIWRVCRGAHACFPLLLLAPRWREWMLRIEWRGCQWSWLGPCRFHWSHRPCHPSSQGWRLALISGRRLSLLPLAQWHWCWPLRWLACPCLVPQTLVLGRSIALQPLVGWSPVAQQLHLWRLSLLQLCPLPS